MRLAPATQSAPDTQQPGARLGESPAWSTAEAPTVAPRQQESPYSDDESDLDIPEFLR